MSTFIRQLKLAETTEKEKENETHKHTHNKSNNKH